ncbi:MAG: DUF1491 family protein [Phyllobacterium sp.]
MRLTSEFWVAALIRRVNGSGAFAALLKRGATEAGAIFIKVRNADGRYDLFGPAPQSAYDERKPEDRLFVSSVSKGEEAEADARLASEKRFDPDLWIVEIEDYRGEMTELFPVREE